MRYINIFGVLFFSIAILINTTIQSQKKEAKFRENIVSISVKDEPFSDVIEYLRARTGKNIIYDKKIKKIYVTIELVQVPWKKVLEIIAQEHNCVVKDLGNDVIKVTKPPVVNMSFEGANIRDTINQIATLADKNIVVSEQVKGTVSLRLKDVPWLDALETIIKTKGYVLLREKEGRIIRIVPPDEVQKQTETRIFKLRYVRPKSIYVAKMKSEYFTQQKVKLGGAGVEVSGFTLLNALKAVVTPNTGKITYDEATNTLIITDIRPKIDKMAEIIKELDKEPKQVFIDIKFIRTTNSDVLDFGMDIGEDGVRISQNFGSMSHSLPFTIGKRGWEDSIAAISTEDSKNEGFPNTTSMEKITTAPVKFGVLDFTKANFTLKLLKKDIKSKIIQAPKIITLDHHEATIFVGRSVAYVETEIQQQDNGTSTVQMKEAANSPAREGFQVLIVPHIIPGTNKVQLTVIPSNDSLTGTTSNITGFNQFSAGAGTSATTMDLPEFTQQTIVTHMILENNQTAVLGGLMKITQQETVRKIPFLGDIPFLGYMFKYKNVTKSKEDLFIFITPRIVQSAENTTENVKASVINSINKNRSKYSSIWQQKK